MPANMTPDEIEKYLAQQQDLLAKGVITQEEFNDAVKDAAVAQKGYTAQLRASMTQLKKSATELGSAMVKGESGASVYNDSINSAAKAVDSFASKFGIVGKVIGGVVTVGAKYVAAVNEQADALMKNYQDLSRGGLATGLDDTFKNLQKMGYTMSEIGDMSGLMKNNVETLTNFGGSAADGAKKFAGAAKEIQYSQLGTQFKRMGMSVNDINGGIAGYLKMQQLSGSTQRQDASQVAASAAAYMEQQDILTKLTGASAQRQQEIIEQAMAQEQFAITQYNLKRKADAGDLEAAKKLKFNNDYMIALTQKGATKTAADFAQWSSGNLASKGAQTFERSLGGAADYMRKGGTDVGKAMDLTGKDAAKTLQANTALYSVGVGEKYTEGAGELVKIVGGTKESMEEAQDRVKAQQKFQKDGGDKAAKNMVDMTNKQRNVTMTADALTNKGIVPTTAAMGKLAGGIDSVTGVLDKISGKQGSIGGTPAAGGGGAPAGSSAPTPGGKGSGPNLSVSGSQSSVQVGNEVRSGGSINWRNNNPGNIRAGAFATSMGAIGENGGFAVFPTEELGRKAADTLLKGKAYANLNAAEAIAKWAPSGDNNNPAQYAATLSAKTGIDMTKKYSDMTPTEQAKFLDAMSRIEGGKAGTVTAKNQSSSPIAADVARNQTNKPSAAMGGILGGPRSGYQAMLHGTEAVVPLPDGRTIPVQMSGNNNDQEQVALLSQELDKLDMLVRIMQKQNSVSGKILQKQS